MKTSDFYYDLPQRLIAQTPAQPRDAARMMVIHRLSGRREDIILCAPSEPRSFTAPSSSRSRDSVAWVTSTPLSASSRASWVCEVTGPAEISSTIRACRADRVTAVVTPSGGWEELSSG